MFLDWKDFANNNKNATTCFESLARVFFKLYYTGTIKTPLQQVLNNPGIETDPLLVDGKRIGFQAKFFENAIDYSSIKGSWKRR